MKVYSFLLAILIFGQSLSVCRPAVLPLKIVDNTIVNCALPKNAETSKSCCSHKSKAQGDKDDNSKGCCGDQCNCFTCVKLIIQYFDCRITIVKLEKFINRKVNIGQSFHSFDFHPAIKNPPKFTV